MRSKVFGKIRLIGEKRNTTTIAYCFDGVLNDAEKSTLALLSKLSQDR